MCLLCTAWWWCVSPWLTNVMHPWLSGRFPAPRPDAVQLPLDSTADCGEPLPPDFGEADDGFKQTIIHGVVSWSTRSAVLISMSLLSDHCRCRCVNLRQPWEARAVASEGGREGRSWKTSSAQAIRRELGLCSNAGAHCCALHQRWPQSNQCRHRLSTGRSGVTSFGRLRPSRHPAPLLTS